MNKKLLIEQDPSWARVAVLENDRAAELFVERRRHSGVVGNIYKGRVNRVLPGMQAAFVDIGLRRDAFLYVREVRDEIEHIFGDEFSESSDEALPAEHELPSIDELLRPGQEVLVQVTKDPLPNKGARVTTHITLPGRSLVFLPTQGQLGISRKIEDEEERDRLHSLLEELSDEKTGGMIVRTAGEGADLEAFAEDLTYLRRLWEKVVRRGIDSRPPSLLHHDLQLPLRMVRDVFDESFDVLWVDGEETYEAIVEFLDLVQPDLVHRVRLSQHRSTLFERFNVEKAIEEALQPKVWLKNGGSIVINPTEALVAIDVNTGRYVGRNDLEQTVLETNLEAVRELVRQIRIRNLGGIIVIDFIDMIEEENRKRVFEALEEELLKDRARTRVLSISEFGLVELTRKRTRASLERVLTRHCPYCQGAGRISSASVVASAIRREVLSWVSRGAREVVIRVHPDIARYLHLEEPNILGELEEALGNAPILESDESQHHENFDVVQV